MDASDSPRRLTAIGRRKPTDREIVAHDRCVISGPRSSCDRGHQSVFTASDGLDFLWEISLKTDVFFPLKLNS